MMVVGQTVCEECGDTIREGERQSSPVTAGDAVGSVLIVLGLILIAPFALNIVLSMVGLADSLAERLGYWRGMAATLPLAGGILLMVIGTSLKQKR